MNISKTASNGVSVPFVIKGVTCRPVKTRYPVSHTGDVLYVEYDGVQEVLKDDLWVVDPVDPDIPPYALQLEGIQSIRTTKDGWHVCIPEDETRDSL